MNEPEFNPFLDEEDSLEDNVELKSLLPERSLDPAYAPTQPKSLSQEDIDDEMPPHREYDFELELEKAHSAMSNYVYADDEFSDPLDSPKVQTDDSENSNKATSALPPITVESEAALADDVSLEDFLSDDFDFNGSEPTTTVVEETDLDWDFEDDEFSVNPNDESPPSAVSEVAADDDFAAELAGIADLFAPSTESAALNTDTPTENAADDSNNDFDYASLIDSDDDWGVEDEIEAEVTIPEPEPVSGLPQWSEIATDSGGYSENSDSLGDLDSDDDWGFESDDTSENTEFASDDDWGLDDFDLPTESHSTSTVSEDEQAEDSFMPSGDDFVPPDDPFAIPEEFLDSIPEGLEADLDDNQEDLNEVVGTKGKKKSKDKKDANDSAGAKKSALKEKFAELKKQIKSELNGGNEPEAKEPLNGDSDTEPSDGVLSKVLFPYTFVVGYIVQGINAILGLLGGIPIVGSLFSKIAGFEKGVRFIAGLVPILLIVGGLYLHGDSKFTGTNKDLDFPDGGHVKVVSVTYNKEKNVGTVNVQNDGEVVAEVIPQIDLLATHLSLNPLSVFYPSEFGSCVGSIVKVEIGETVELPVQCEDNTAIKVKATGELVWASS